MATVPHEATSTLSSVPLPGGAGAALAGSSSAAAVMLQPVSTSEGAATDTTTAVESVQMRADGVVLGAAGAVDTAAGEKPTSVTAVGDTGAASSNRRSEEAVSNSTSRGGAENRKAPPLGLSAAGESLAFTLVSCSAQERLQRILEMKKALDQFREDDLAECSAVRSGGGAADSGGSTLQKQQGGGRASFDCGADAAKRDPLHLSSILDMFAILSQVNMTREILSKTRIGVSVGKLRSHPNSQVRSRASELVAKWKACIGVTASPGVDSPSPSAAPVSASASATAAAPTTRSSPAAAGSARPACASRSREEGFAGGVSTGGIVSRADSLPAAGTAGGNSAFARGNSKAEQPYNDAGEKASGAAGGGSASPGSAYSDFRGPLTGDSVRDRARMFLWKALLDGMQQQQQQGGGGAAAPAVANGGETAAQVASQVEEALWEEYCVRRRSTKEYTAQLKTLKWNLADPKNPDLNLKVLCGVFTPEQLATMTSAELASDEKKRLREQQKKESMEACQSDWEMKKLMQGAGAEGQFPCFKCRTTKTVYFQMQTRSSDEPMTTFVTCLECGNRWKF